MQCSECGATEFLLFINVTAEVDVVDHETVRVRKGTKVTKQDLSCAVCFASLVNVEVQDV